MIRTMDFQDSNFDGIDDRDQDQFGRRTRFPGQPFQDMRARLGGIADMIRARDAAQRRAAPCKELQRANYRQNAKT